MALGSRVVGGLLPGLPLVALLGLSSAAAAHSIFFPVDDGKIVLPFECRAEQSLTWTRWVRKTLNGMAPGASVRVVYDDGETAPGRLGEVVCYVGECRGNYVSVTVEAPQRPAPVVAAITADSRERVPAALVPGVGQDSPEACGDLPPQGMDPDGFGLEPVEPLCRSYGFAGLTELGSVELAGQGWMQDHGWAIYSFFGRAVGATSQGPRKGPWQDLAYSTNPPEPRFAYADVGGAVRVLWTQYEGIVGPARITFRESRLEPGGGLTWLSRYTAGGQPCD